MINIKWRLLGLLLVMTMLSGCLYEFPMYRMATDGLDKKEYLVVGRVMDSQARPIKNCRVSLSRYGFCCKPEVTPASVTDSTGTYQIAFEVKTCYLDYGLTFDASDQGFPVRYQSISHLLESTLFQYTGNNPVTMNMVMNKTSMVRPAAQHAESATGF